MDIEFSSLKELYQRLSPALETKRMDMIRSGYSYVQKEDIWDYLKNEKWNEERNLSLAEMVSDILNSDNDIIDRYLKRKSGTYHYRSNLERE